MIYQNSDICFFGTPCCPPPPHPVLWLRSARAASTACRHRPLRPTLSGRKTTLPGGCEEKALGEGGCWLKNISNFKEEKNTKLKESQRSVAGKPPSQVVVRKTPWRGGMCGLNKICQIGRTSFERREIKSNFEELL